MTKQRIAIHWTPEQKSAVYAAAAPYWTTIPRREAWVKAQQAAGIAPDEMRPFSHNVDKDLQNLHGKPAIFKHPGRRPGSKNKPKIQPAPEAIEHLNTAAAAMRPTSFRA